MVYEQESKNKYVIRLAKGDELIENLEMFVEKEEVEGGFFYGLGASDNFEIAHYNVETQKYSSKKFTDAYEITNLAGNVAFKEDGVYVHVHGTFGDKDMKTVGGHVVSAVVSGTLEIFFTKTQALVKAKDPETGLQVLQLEQRC